MLLQYSYTNLLYRIKICGSDYFEDEADTATAKMTAALEPVMIIIMAVIVGIVVGGCALPILNMASFINF